MVLLTRQVRFAAGHRYFLPELSEEENARLYGVCANANGHGHDYCCEVTVQGEIDAATGMVINIEELKQLLRDVVVEPLDREFLTIEHPVCRGRVPTSENLVRSIWRGMEHGLAVRAGTGDKETRRQGDKETGRHGEGETPGPVSLSPAVRLHRVRLAESRWLAVDCMRKEGEPTVFLTRTYEFSAAHRLHSPKLSEEKNLEIFGKCNNPYGHGHNYLLEVTVQGDVDERSGLMVDLGYLDGIVEDQVVRRYDHRNLNLDLPEFVELNPTTENLVKVIWHRLAPHLKHPPLYRVTVRETERNCFSFYGDGD